MTRELAAISRRAKAAGDLRADFALDDFMLVFLAGQGLTALPAPDRAGAARRFAAVALEGLRAAEENRPLPPPARLASRIIQAGGERATPVAGTPELSYSDTGGSGDGRVGRVI
jgi:hypothetical protein